MDERYKKYAEHHAPKSPLIKDCARAFVSGGAVCAAGEGLKNMYISFGMNNDDASLMCSVTLIFAAILLTGLGVFDEIARVAGAGVLVPITGFANAVAAPAIDAKTEGYVLGVGAKIFTVAGPVILYGVTSGALYGAIYMIVSSIT
ncbi:MAG: SpoVA/SpoVAEb family sporulation membrane protein [Clostridia bacterium]|nr:SpoVA/SpoVAEb family sporulation membrane protein [Clostridia bacterium]